MAKTALALDDVSPAELLKLLGRATDGSDVTTEEVARFLDSKHDDKTKARVLKWFSKVARAAREKVGLGDLHAEVVIRPAHRGRVTGFSMVCLGCGIVATQLAPNFERAKLGAIGHLRIDHESVGSINARPTKDVPKTPDE